MKRVFFPQHRRLRYATGLGRVSVWSYLVLSATMARKWMGACTLAALVVCVGLSASCSQDDEEGGENLVEEPAPPTTPLSTPDPIDDGPSDPEELSQPTRGPDQGLYGGGVAQGGGKAGGGKAGGKGSGGAPMCTQGVMECGQCQSWCQSCRTDVGFCVQDCQRQLCRGGWNPPGGGEGFAPVRNEVVLSDYQKLMAMRNPCPEASNTLCVTSPLFHLRVHGRNTRKKFTEIPPFMDVFPRQYDRLRPRDIKMKFGVKSLLLTIYDLPDPQTFEFVYPSTVTALMREKPANTLYDIVPSHPNARSGQRGYGLKFTLLSHGGGNCGYKGVIYSGRSAALNLAEAYLQGVGKCR